MCKLVVAIVLHQPASPSLLVSTMADAETAGHATAQPAVAIEPSHIAAMADAMADAEMAANATEHGLDLQRARLVQ